MADKKKLGSFIDSKAASYTELSDKIWEFAETRFSLAKSADVQCDFLEKEGFSVTRGAAGMDDAIVAEFGSGLPVIGFLGEYDALPKLSQVSGAFEKTPLVPDAPGHGCGHNLLGIGDLAAACAVKEFMIREKIKGTVRYYGCPAEESGCGKTYMAREGLFDGVDAFITWHPMNELRVWSFSTLANYQVCFEFKGRSAHAAAAPEHGRSALDAAELMNIGVNYLREHIIQEARVHYAYLDTGGQSPNVVQPYAKLLYFIRAPKSSQVAEIFARVLKIAEGAALMTETEMKMSWDASCAEFLPNDVIGRAMHKNMEELGAIEYNAEETAFAKRYVDALPPEAAAGAASGIKKCFRELGEDKIAELIKKPIIGDIFPYEVIDKPISGSSDVGDASWIAPTAMFTTPTYPVGTVCHSWQYVACGKSDMAHKSMLYAAKVLAMTAIDILTLPELLKQAKKEHKDTLGGEKYVCPIPKEVLPGQKQ